MVSGAEVKEKMGGPGLGEGDVRAPRRGDADGKRGGQAFFRQDDRRGRI